MAITHDSKKWGFEYVQGVAPSNPKQGTTWFDTTEDRAKVYTGTAWVNMYSSVGDYGYIMGGISADAEISNVDRITFPFDSGTASNVGNLSVTNSLSCGCNSSNYGYNMGGFTTPGITFTSIINRIDFPFSSGTASNVGGLTANKGHVTGFNSSAHGYYCGGWNNSVYSSTIERITFPHNSGTANAVGNLAESKYGNAGCNSSQHGFAMGGFVNPTFQSQVNRLAFPFDSGTASSVGSLTIGLYQSAGCNSSLYGYSIGGQSPSYSNIERITFPFASGTASHVGNLSSTAGYGSGLNSDTYGYCCGHNRAASSIERFAFPFDSGTASMIGNLSGSHIAAGSCDETDFVTQFI